MKVFIIISILVALTSANPFREHSKILVRIDDPSIFDSVSNPVYPPLEQPAQAFRLVPEPSGQSSYGGGYVQQAAPQTQSFQLTQVNGGSNSGNQQQSTTGRGYSYAAPQQSQNYRSSSSSGGYSAPVAARLVHTFTEQKIENSPVTGGSYQSSYVSRRGGNGNSGSYAGQSSYNQP